MCFHVGRICRKSPHDWFAPRLTPTSWLTESSTQPSCSSSKTPSGFSLLITKASSTCSVGPSHAASSLPLVSCVFFWWLSLLRDPKQRNTLTWRRLSVKRVWTFTRNSSPEWLGYRSSSKWPRFVCVDFSLLLLKVLLEPPKAQTCLSSHLNSRWASIEETSRTFRRWAKLRSKPFLHCFFLIFISNLFVSVCSAKKKKKSPECSLK